MIVPILVGLAVAEAAVREETANVGQVVEWGVAAGDLVVDGSYEIVRFFKAVSGGGHCVLLLRLWGFLISVGMLRTTLGLWLC